MKTSIMIIAIGLLGTAAFAQNAKSDISQTHLETENSEGLKSRISFKRKRRKAQRIISQQQLRKS
jgi:hypothetical protein